MNLTSTTQSLLAGDDTLFRQDFYKKIEPIKLIDPLSFALGATEKGEPFFYHFTDIVKYSGHSCPSVVGAYKMTQIALKELYGDETAIRGNIRVAIKGSVEDKVNGPISQVISFITGAAGNTGFKGLNGKFNRYNLLSFDSDNPSTEDVSAEAMFERMDNAKKVNIAYKANRVPGNPEMGELMPLIISGKATMEEMQKFGNLWQERVKIVLLNPPDGAFIVTYLE